jgi:hypothetical protein
VKEHAVRYSRERKQATRQRIIEAAGRRFKTDGIDGSGIAALMADAGLTNGALGWADFQVRSDIAIRRHQVLVTCAFSFCWATWFADHPPQRHDTAPQPEPGGGERGAARRHAGPAAVLAPGDPGGPRLAFPLDRAAALVDRMVQSAPAPPAPSPDQLGRGRLRPAPLHPELTNYR